MTGQPGTAVPFTKMSGGGNDFLVVEAGDLADLPDLGLWIRSVCRRGLSVGADGVLVMEGGIGTGARMIHYNADGGRSSLCGNGSRCAARWAHQHGWGGDPLTLETDSGPVVARFPAPGRASVRLSLTCAAPEPRRLELGEGGVAEGYFLSVGIPHFLEPVRSLEEVPVGSRGRQLRSHRTFGAAGANATFLQVGADGSLHLRTFERGVEAETLACGTACLAAAILAVDRGWSRAPVICHTRSGLDLIVGMEQVDGGYTGLTLEGDARVIYRGQLTGEALGRAG